MGLSFRLDHSLNRLRQSKTKFIMKWLLKFVAKVGGKERFQRKFSNLVRKADNSISGHIRVICIKTGKDLY